jgi:glucose/arabinose dehydrogenase
MTPGSSRKLFGKMKQPPLPLLLLVCCAAVLISSAHATPKEEDFYRLITIPIPEGIVLETGALQIMPDQRLAVATRHGDIYMVHGIFNGPIENVEFKLFARGLHEILGLALHDGWLYATQRGEITRLKDLDGDGRADLFETVSDSWGISGDYHEYAFSSKFDRQTNLWTGLCLTGSFTSDIDYRGWALRISPDGKMTPTSSGLRSPGGIGTNSLGDMFFTENQGPWNGTCSLKHLAPGAFMGHPGGNDWYKLTETLGPRPPDPLNGSRIHLEAARIPQLMPPAVLFPYNKMGQSASGFATDGTGGNFGPFQNQLFVGDQTHSTVMRVYLEKVNGRYQGACFPFREGFASGNLSLEFAQDGSLFVGGTDRGWGARGGKPFALQRLVWTRQIPFEIHEMRARFDGFELTFTQPINPATATDPGSYQIETYTYIYQESYGSPEVDHTTPVIQEIKVAPDALSVRLILDGLQIGHVHELHLPGIRSATGLPLLHPVAYYTLNAIPQPPAGQPTPAAIQNLNP